MADKIVLCRRDNADFGEVPSFCCKPIIVPNASNFCEDHRARLPYWPTDSAPAVQPQEVA